MELKIIEVKDPNGNLLLRHSLEQSNLNEGLSNYQAEVESYTATAKNPFFKNSFAPLPEILSTINEGYKKFGMVRRQAIVGNFLVSTDTHVKSGEFYETWANLLDSSVDINNWKGAITSLNRIVSQTATNMGAEVDDDNGSGNTKSTLLITLNTDANYLKAEAEIKDKVITSKQQLYEKYKFNTSPTNLKLQATKKAKESLESMFN